MDNLVERLRTGGSRTVVAALIIGLLVIGGAWTLRAQSDADVVARVNGEVITKDDLYDAMFSQIGRQMLDELILIRLVEQEADARGVSVAQEDVDAEVERLAAQVGGFGQLEFLLMQQGYDLDQLADEIRFNLTMRALIVPGIEVTDEEVKQFFDENTELFAQEEMVRARHILVDSREEAEALRKQLEEGADFAELAREHSTDRGSGAQGGDLGWFGRGRMVAPFEQAAFTLEVGELSEPVETTYGFHLIKVEERVEAADAVFDDEVAALIREGLTDEKVQQQLGPWLQTLRSKADIEVLVGD